VTEKSISESMKERPIYGVDPDDGSKTLGYEATPSEQYRIAMMEKELELYREFYEVHREVEHGIISFDLHNKTVKSMQELEERILDWRGER